jgi:hypothetical protein
VLAFALLWVQPASAQIDVQDGGTSLRDAAAPGPDAGPVCEPYGVRLSGGGCEYPAGFCTAAADCPESTYCNFELIPEPGLGFCSQTPACVTDADCETGLVCTPEPRCLSENACSMEGARCAPPFPETGDCHTSADCSEGFECLVGRERCVVTAGGCQIEFSGHCQSICGDPLDIYLPGQGCVLFEVPPGQSYPVDPPPSTSGGAPSTAQTTTHDSACAIALGRGTPANRFPLLLLTLALLAVRRRKARCLTKPPLCS